MIALLGKQWTREECIDVIQGKPSPRLSDKESAAVDFARAVARRPAGITDEQTAALRAIGWTDSEIVASVALMRYTTTVTSALDVPLEKTMEGVGISCGVPLDRLDA
jgi:alkylhydroperoxidase family enzyme